MKICPVCETQNKDGAKNCEICGEQLAIPQAPPAGAAPAPAAPTPATQPADAAPAAPVEPAAAAAPPAPGAPAAGPKWCPIEGLEYAPGTDENEDGFCSCGSELVADKALVRPDAAPLPPEERGLPADLGTATAAPEATPAPAAVPLAEPEPEPEPPPPPSGPTAPPAGTWCLVVYQNRQPAHYHAVVHDETLIGRADPFSGAHPQLDVTPFDAEAVTSRKHAYVYRQENEYTLKPITNSGTQLGKELVEMGERRTLTDGDVIILAGRIAIKFIQVK